MSSVSARSVPSCICLALVLLAGCEPTVVVPVDQLAIFQAAAVEPAADTPSSVSKILLGKTLYHEARLSRKGKVSCATCHSLDTFGVDGKPTSTGTGGQVGGRNAPTSLNAFRQLAQFWDGRAATVEAQAVGPILNPIEHGLRDAAEVVGILKKDEAFVGAFQMAFPDSEDPITLDNVGRAIGAFERTLVTRSRFDDYLDGDVSKLSNAEKQGLLDFMATGCTTCHFTRMVGGQMYNKLGLMHPYDTKDLGRFELTKNEAEKYFFKVPSLLNIEKTGPYFHNGSITSLEEAVRLMAWHQLGKKLDADKIQSIVTFLKSLTGTLQD